MKKGFKAINVFFAVIGVVAVITIIGIFLLINHNKKTVTYTGLGMAPALQSGKKYTVNLYPNGQPPQRGDIVEFTRSSRPSPDTLRVIALAGEHVIISNGQVTVYNSVTPSGFNPDIAYLAKGITTPGNIDMTVPANGYFLLGDNRSSSLDSRLFGPILLSDIIGKVSL